ncbi:MAG: hypothetical protein ACNS61_04455 [Candidatus Wenzhouxiangella sp. M2_3B_020]
MTTSVAIKILAAAVAVALSGPALAQEDPRELPDDTWISLSGTVTSTTADTFRLDYGDGMIIVEMDDWDDRGETFPLMDGDKVTVYGEVDNVFVNDTIEAASVYVDDLNSFFYASSADEEELGVWAVDTVVTVGDVSYVGTVQSVDPMTDAFAIDTGKQELTVNVDALLYDPLDDEGFQKIEVGDVVSVEGTLDEDFFTNNDLVADSIVTLVD